MRKVWKIRSTAQSHNKFDAEGGGGRCPTPRICRSRTIGLSFSLHAFKVTVLRFEISGLSPSEVAMYGEPFHRSLVCAPALCKGRACVWTRARTRQWQEVGKKCCNPEHLSRAHDVYTGSRTKRRGSTNPGHVHSQMTKGACEI